MVTRARKVG
jgi:glutaryl-CoA dehydrogenase